MLLEIEFILTSDRFSRLISGLFIYGSFHMVFPDFHLHTDMLYGTWAVQRQSRRWGEADHFSTQHRSFRISVVAVYPRFNFCALAINFSLVDKFAFGFFLPTHHTQQHDAYGE